MNNESQTISIESILHQATTPWLSFILAPLGYCFIGLISALRQQQFHYCILSFYFYFCSYLLTRKFISQTSTSSREKEMASHCINECYPLCHSLYFYQTVAIRVVLLHSLPLCYLIIRNLFEVKVNEVSYLSPDY